MLQAQTPSIPASAGEAHEGLALLQGRPAVGDWWPGQLSRPQSCESGSVGVQAARFVLQQGEVSG